MGPYTICTKRLLITTMVVMAIKPSLQQSCSSKSVKHYALTGSQYKRLHTTDYPGCVLKCIKDGICKSLNYLMTEGVCELNSKTKESSPHNFLPRVNNMYFTNIIPATMPKATTTPPTVAVATETPLTNETPVTTMTPEKFVTAIQQASLKVPGEVFKSCLTVVTSGKSAGTGLYLLDPGNTGKPVQALCDMSTDGGGWTVVKNTIIQNSTIPSEAEDASTCAELLSIHHIQHKNVRPTSTGILDVKQVMGFHQIHFYCHKKTVGRVVSIMTKNNTAGQQVLEYFMNDTYAESHFPDACGSFERLPGDTSIVAQNCTLWGSQPGKWGHSSNTGRLRISTNTFSYENNHQFGMESRNGKFACDDTFNDGPFSAGDILMISVR